MILDKKIRTETEGTIFVLIGGKVGSKFEYLNYKYTYAEKVKRKAIRLGKKEGEAPLIEFCTFFRIF